MANYPFILTSELVNIKHGKYIVKVCVHQNQQIITTAHSEGYTVEEAEDNARKRAILFANESVNVHNVQNIPVSTTNKVTSSPPVEQKSKPPTNSPSTKTNLSENITHPPAPPQKPPIKPPMSPQKEIKPSEITPPPLQNENPPEEITPPSINHSDETLPLEIPENQNGKEEILSTPTNDIEESTTLPLSLDTNETMDFSQIIDQTTFEMKRLGWTQDHGKKYLLETYGKKSRHLLSDQELIEFLQYLQSQ